MLPRRSRIVAGEPIRYIRDVFNGPGFYIGRHQEVQRPAGPNGMVSNFLTHFKLRFKGGDLHNFEFLGLPGPMTTTVYLVDEELSPTSRKTVEETAKDIATDMRLGRHPQSNLFVGMRLLAADALRLLRRYGAEEGITRAHVKELADRLDAGVLGKSEFHVHVNDRGEVVGVTVKVDGKYKTVANRDVRGAVSASKAANGFIERGEHRAYGAKVTPTYVLPGSSSYIPPELAQPLFRFMENRRTNRNQRR